jgi:hypothetical protein
MSQLARRTEPLNEMLVRTTNVGLAASALNLVLNGVDIPLQRERVALAIWNKLVPSLAAIHMEVADHRPTSVHDLNAMLISSGLDALTGESQLIDTPGDSDSAVGESETGAPPEVEA